MDIQKENLNPEFRKYLNEWVAYVANFYLPEVDGVLYPIEGLTRDRLESIILLLILNGKLDNGIDSFDREFIRDLLLLGN